MSRILTGLDVLKDEYWKKLRDRRVGLLSNQASLDCNLTSAKDIITGLLPGCLNVLFGPQHGHGGEDQDNMIETDHSRETNLDIPVYSLYSSNRTPLPEMLDLIDILIIDLQDVGTRVYTFASTMLNCLKAAAGAGKKVLILDRPNPLGGEIVEGNLLKTELYSFVGPFRLPMRHGLTMGELALLFKDVFKIDLDLEIVQLQGWARNMVWNDTGLRWIMPSPNMPLPETVY
ncbi:exo-beta-N-acetylmuramidase NamZ domain-containing protein, partial [Thermodesulfobacteriota bacterium]